MNDTPTLSAMMRAIHNRNDERTLKGEPPLDEMILPAETYDRLISEVTSFSVRPSEPPICMGVKIKRMSV
jgi:hypothetical protein